MRRIQHCCVASILVSSRVPTYVSMGTTKSEVYVRDGLLDRPRVARRPATVEIVVVLEVLALLVAVALFSLTPDRPVSCQKEVTVVRDAITQYHLSMGN